MTTNTWTAPIFFDVDEVEGVAAEEAIITLNYTVPVVLPAETQLKTNSLLLAHEPEPVITMSATTDFREPRIGVPAPAESLANISPWLWLVSSLGVLLLGMLLVDTYQFVATQYANSFFLGTLFLAVILSIVAATATLTWRAYTNLQAFRTVSVLQQEGRKLLVGNGYGNAIHYINKVAYFYVNRPDIKARLDRFYVTLSDSHHDNEICMLFSAHVMKELDQQAYHIVLQRSKETALLVMVSPIALLDTVLTLWRNVRLIRDVATLYGGRPGFLESMSLLTSVLQNLVYADVSEVLADGVVDTFGHSVLAVVSAQAAQGVGSGLLTARVGLRAMEVCRPLPFTEEEKPRLKEIRWEIVSSLKKLFESNKKPEKSKK